MTLFDLKAGEPVKISTGRSECLGCGIVKNNLTYWAIPTNQYANMDGVMRRFFLRHNDACSCKTYGTWLSDGPAPGQDKK